MAMSGMEVYVQTSMNAQKACVMQPNAWIVQEAKVDIFIYFVMKVYRTTDLVIQKKAIHVVTVTRGSSKTTQTAVI